MNLPFMPDRNLHSDQVCNSRALSHSESLSVSLQRHDSLIMNDRVLCQLNIVYLIVKGIKAPRKLHRFIFRA